MKRLYTYSDFVHNSIKESQDINSNMEVFALNEMQPSWTPEETKSMYGITKDNIYQMLKEKFFQRIDIILVGDDDLFTGTLYNLEMDKDILQTKSYKFTRKEVSDKIKKVWKEKIFLILNFNYFNEGYDAFKNLGKIDFGDDIKNSWKIVEFAYPPNGDWTTKIKNSQTSSLLNTYLSTSKSIYKDVTDSIYENSGIKSDQEYTDILKKLKKAESSGTFPWKDLDAKLKFEFFEYYRHYHFWLFANLIMSGKLQSTASTTASSSKTKSSSGSTTSTTSSPKRERLNVDRNAVGERFSGL